MVKPSQVYTTWKRETLLAHIQKYGYRVIAFRKPLPGEFWVTQPYGEVVTMWPPSISAAGMRLIVEKL